MPTQTTATPTVAITIDDRRESPALSFFRRVEDNFSISTLSSALISAGVCIVLGEDRPEHVQHAAAAWTEVSPARDALVTSFPAVDQAGSTSAAPEVVPTAACGGECGASVAVAVGAAAAAVVVVVVVVEAFLFVVR